MSDSKSKVQGLNKSATRFADYENVSRMSSIIALAGLPDKGRN